MRSDKDPRIIIVGGSGFIGRNLVTRLADSGLSVHATYRHDTSFVDWSSKWPNVTPVKFDGSRASVQLDDFDICLYIAGNANHTWALNNQVEDLQLNTISMLNALSGFRGRCIYLSSGAVYYGLNGFVSPMTPVEPVFPYAISKYSCELYIKHLHHIGQLHGYTIIRLYYAYGPYESRRRLIPTLIRKLLFENVDSFVLNGDGQTLMAPLYIDDVTKALSQAALLSGENQTVDLCADSPMTLQAIVEQICLALGRQIKIEHQPTQEEKINFWSSNSEACRLYNLGNPIPLIEGVKTYSQWILSMGAKG